MNENESNIQTVTAQNLRCGMVTIGSGHTIEHVFTSVRCPSGKIHVAYTTKYGKRVCDTWNKQTTIQVFVPTY
jgi:hypothetical protein